MRLAGCLITSRLRLRQPDAAGVIAQVERAVDAGIDLVQVRERDLEGRALYDLADALNRAGESARALAVFIELEADAGSYRDVADRIELLTRAGASTPANGERG